jgi:hypothetical protein
VALGVDSVSRFGHYANGIIVFDSAGDPVYFNTQTMSKEESPIYPDEVFNYQSAL